MSKKFQGRGWRFPIIPDATGTLRYNEHEENIEQSLRVLLLTAKGERVMRPEFGSKAPRLVFAPGSLQYLRLLETSIREAIRDFEPRVTVLDVRATADAEDATQVIVAINYRIRRSNSRHNLVFPFYLGNLEVLG